MTLTNSSHLVFTGSGAGGFLFTQSGAMSGNVPSGDTVTIAGVTATNDTDVTEPAGFTNAGTITLTTQGAHSGSAQIAELDWNGTFTNSGTVNTTLGSTVGARVLDGVRLDDSGTLNAGVSTEDDVSHARLSNSGTVSVAAGAVFSLPSTATTCRGPVAR